MATLSSSFLSPRAPSLHLSSSPGSSSKSPNKLAFDLVQPGKPTISKRQLTIHASYRDDGRSSNGGVFIGGFILGGLVMGALGAVYAPQISRAISGTDKKDLMRKLPKFIYDEDKALERQRKKLAEKIEQLNSAIDDVSNQLRPENSANEEDMKSEEVEALA